MDSVIAPFTEFLSTLSSLNKPRIPITVEPDRDLDDR